MGGASSSEDEGSPRQSKGGPTKLKFQGTQKVEVTSDNADELLPHWQDLLEVPVEHRWTLVLFKDDSFSFKVESFQAHLAVAHGITVGHFVGSSWSSLPIPRSGATHTSLRSELLWVLKLCKSYIDRRRNGCRSEH